MSLASMQNIMGFHSKPSVQPEQYIKNLTQSYKSGNTAPWDYLHDSRGLKKETIVHFQIGLTERGEIAIPVFKDGELIDYKMRTIPPAEKGFRRHPGAQTWCYNESGLEYAHKEGYLIVTEGEFDAISLWQLGYKNVISIASGAQGPTPWVKRLPEGIKVYLNFDSDEPGQDAARNLAERIGIEKCYNVVFTLIKDANEFLVHEGTAEGFKELLDSAEKFKIKDVFKISEIFEQLKNNKIERLELFSDKLTRHLNGGIPTKSLVMVSGETGQGKSSFVLNTLIGHANNGFPVLLISLENEIYHTVQRILETKYQKVYTSFTKEDWDIIYKEMLDYPFYIDTSMDSYTMEKIEKIVDQAKKTLGIKFLAFDHIGFVPHRDDHKEISAMVREFKLLARKYDIVIYTVNHVNRGDGEYLDADRLKGSSSLGQDSDIILFVIGTKSGHEISIDKNRHGVSKLRVPMIFKGETGIFIDDDDRPVKHYDEIVEEGRLTEKNIDY